MRARPRPWHLGAAAFSGLALFVAGEPIGAGPLAWVALVPLLWAVLAEKRWRWAWAYGLVFGGVFFGVHLSWIFLFGWLAWVPLVVVLSLYLSAATFLGSVMRRWPFAPALVAGAWAGMELVRDRWPFGGYPWGTAGTTQATVPGVRWLAGVVGVYGLTFLIVFVAALVADRLLSGRWSWGSLALVSGGLLVFVGVDLVAYGTPPEGKEQRVLVVQGGVPRPPRPNQRDLIFESHVELTRQGVRSVEAVDLVVWPEDSLGIGVRSSAPDELAALAREVGAPFLVGRSVISDGAFLNTVEHFRADGLVADRYLKRHPVPFGEYVPIGFLRNAVSTLQAEIPVDQRPGTEAVVFETGEARVSTPICFESVFPRDILDFVRAGAELHVISTNNASFEGSYAAQQHLAHARLRALETRQWIVQAALSGISASIGPDASITHATELFDRARFLTVVEARGAHSLYARTGDLFPAAFAVGTLVAMLVYAYVLARSRERRE